MAWHKAMIVLHRDVNVPTEADRTRSQQLRKAASEVSREKMLGYLETAGLAKEVDVPEATPSKTMLIEASERALHELERAPAVEKVLPFDDDASIELLAE